MRQKVKKYYISSIIFLSVILLAPSCARAIDTSDLRKPNDHEFFYHYAAVSVNEPQLCEKISPRAYLTAGWGGEGSQISLERSECYFDVAIRFGRQDLCEKVVPIITDTLDGRRYSPNRCRQEIQRYGSNDSNGHELPGNKELIAIFSQMGYDYPTVIKQKLIPDPLNSFDVYIQLEQEKDILKRIEALFNSSKVNNIPIEQREMLDDLAAHIVNDVQWCKRIREDALKPDSRYFKNTSQEYFRDGCIFEIASNTRSPTLCNEMTDRPVDPKKVLSLKEQCPGQAGGPRYGQQSHYGYFVPENEQVIQGLLKALDYPLPDFKSLSQDEIRKVYSDFLLALTYPEKDNPFYKKAKEEFIKRFQALPDFK